MTRVRMENRRKCQTQKVKIDNQTFYLTFGFYEDGKLGEVFLEAHKEGTFARGLLSALARMISVAIQSDCPLEDIVRALRGLSFPPQGEVVGSTYISEATSIADWIAQEIEALYPPPIPYRPTPNVFSKE